jgi:DNA-binding NarL/FixJ family response regulator
MQPASKTPKKILIVDDHPMVISGCRSLFASEPGFEIEEAGDAASGYKIFVRIRPEVTIIDVKLPDVSGFELLRRIRKTEPAAKIIIFSMNDDPAFVVRAVEMGVQGYLSKGDDPRLFVKAVRRVLAGENFISPRLAEAVTFSTATLRANPASKLSTRELEILGLLAKGNKIGEVADALDISYKTVANTTSLLKQKLGVKAHSDLIRIAVGMELT